MIIHEISIWKMGRNGFTPSNMKLIARSDQGLLRKNSDEYEITPKITGNSRKNFINILYEDDILIQCKFHGKDSFFKCKFKNFMSNKALFSEGKRIKRNIELPINNGF
jgi:hypothetical protein